MNILLAASEAVPFCKTGGLADVTGALAQVLSRLGHDVRLFLPCYRAVESRTPTLRALPGQFLIPVGDDILPASLLSTTWGSATAYFIQSSKYFAREGLYQEAGKDYEDNDERFIYFSRAVLEAAKFLGFKPDIIHCHDWQTGLIPAYLKTLYRIDAFYVRTASLLTIHNIAYQGMFTKHALFLAGFGWTDFTPDRLEYYGGLNFLKAGLVFADTLNTVSPTYAREIQSSAEFGRGMEGLLRHRSRELHGVLNGIDVDFWNPETDNLLTRNYAAADLITGKAANKAALQKDCGFAENGAPVVGIVSRLDAQKGLDVVIDLAPWLISKGARLVVLGTGDPQLQQAMQKLADSNKGFVCFRHGYDEPFAHKIYAGADLFLMPSRFEPCGLGQMIAMRYGTLPVVTRTGGLADTVRESEEASKPANGFMAERCSQDDVRSALERALALYARRDDWTARVKNAMAFDGSWKSSASVYLDLYQKAQGKAAL